MTEIFLCVAKNRRTTGHGTSDVFIEFTSYYDDEDNLKSYPAFRSRLEAQKFIDKHDSYGSVSTISLELK